MDRQKRTYLIALSALQVIVAIIPGEIVQLAGGRWGPKGPVRCAVYCPRGDRVQ